MALDSPGYIDDAIWLTPSPVRLNSFISPKRELNAACWALKNLFAAPDNFSPFIAARRFNESGKFCMFFSFDDADTNLVHDDETTVNVIRIFKISIWPSLNKVSDTTDKLSCDPFYATRTVYTFIYSLNSW